MLEELEQGLSVARDDLSDVRYLHGSLTSRRVQRTVAQIGQMCRARVAALHGLARQARRALSG